MKEIEFEIYYAGRSIKNTIEFEDDEFEGMDEEEVRNYVYNEIWDDLKHNMEVIIEDLE